MRSRPRPGTGSMWSKTPNLSAIPPPRSWSACPPAPTLLQALQARPKLVDELRVGRREHRSPGSALPTDATQELVQGLARMTLDEPVDREEGVGLRFRVGTVAQQVEDAVFCPVGDE